MNRDNPDSMASNGPAPLMPASSRLKMTGPGSETSIRPDSTLAGLYRSLAEFTVLTDCVRSAVDERLAAAIDVTGWANGILRIRLSRPTLATHWRFQEPAVRRHLARLPAFRGLTDIRLVLAVPAAAGRGRPHRSRIGEAPAGAIRELARDESHPRLRAALEALAAAAEQSRPGGHEKSGDRG